jgi:hypothetical protein
MPAALIYARARGERRDADGDGGARLGGGARSGARPPAAEAKERPTLQEPGSVSPQATALSLR